MDNFHFKKKYGQNFIKEDSIVEKIKNVANIEEGSLIVEIGPGAGSLTKKLVQTKNTVLAYEIDQDLKLVLEHEFSDIDHIHFIFDDFLKRNLIEDFQQYTYRHLYIIANLPYYITTPIISKIIQEVDVYKMVIMVQKEVAERFVAEVGTKEHNSPPPRLHAIREMTASRRLPFVGRTDNADYVSFGITALSAVYLYVGHVTRCRIRDKHNHLRFGLRRHPDTAYRLTFGRNTFNLHRLQQRQCFFLS